MTAWALASTESFARTVDTSRLSAKPRASAVTYVTPRGDDARCVRGNQARPCASLDRAFAVAWLGDTVIVAGGDYPAQVITGKKRRQTGTNLPDVVIHPKRGAVVRLAGLRVDGASHLTLRRLRD
jgi:hypothetical protein